MSFRDRMRRQMGKHRVSMLSAAAPASAMQTLVTALGGDSVVQGIYDDDYNVSVTSAKVNTWDDARGTSGYGPQIVGNTGGGANKPAYLSGTGITTDGTNYIATAAASTKFDMSTPLWMVTISTYGVGAQFGYQSIFSDTVPTSGTPGRWMSATTANKSSIVAAYTFGNIPQAGEGPVAKSSNLRVTSIWITSYQALFGEVSSRIGFEVGGRMRQYLTATATSGGNYLSYGLGNSQKQADTVRAIVIGSGNLTQAQMTAIKTYAATKSYVLEATKPKALSCIGDSLTFGFLSTAPATNSFPAQLMSRNAAAMASYEMQNYGISARRISGMKLLAPIDVYPQLGTFHTKDIVTVWGGTNDIADGGGTGTDATVIADLITMGNAIRATGAKAVLIPAIPRGDTGVNATTQGYLSNVSAWCQSTGATYYDVVVPLYSDARFNDFNRTTGSCTNVTNYNADKVHLTDTGYTAIADLVFTAISGIL